MGCDIHGVVERLYKGKWVGIERFGGRNYSMFAHLADVRNYNSLGDLEAQESLLKAYKELKERAEKEGKGTIEEMRIDIKKIDEEIKKKEDLIKDFEIITPISEPRGMPIDSSDLIILLSDEMWQDAHSNSFVSFEEMKTLVDKLSEEQYKWEIENYKKFEEMLNSDLNPNDDLEAKIRMLENSKPPEERKFKWDFEETWLGDTGRYFHEESEYIEDIRYTFFFDN